MIISIFAVVLSNHPFDKYSLKLLSPCWQCDFDQCDYTIVSMFEDRRWIECDGCYRTWLLRRLPWRSLTVRRTP